ncbi:MAG: hypothetical protein Q7U57_08225 [Methylovulum sp.]|nr:hypothetical protein [Methylovulum sp.]
MIRSATKTFSLSESGTLTVVSFKAGGHRFAVEAAQVHTQLSVETSDTVLTAEQLLGLPVYEDLQNRASRSILLMKHPAGNYAMAVSNPVELLLLEINAIYPLPALIVARNTLAGIRGLAIGSSGITVLVDFCGLHQKVFLQELHFKRP